MADETTSISSSRISAADIHRANFAVVRRGFEPREVRSFLDHISHELELSEQREQELRRLVSEAEMRAANPVISESMLTAALGQQSAAILRSAHEEAEKVLGAAQAQASQLVQEAQHRASAIAVDSEQRAAERVGAAEQDAANLEAQALAHAQEVVARAKADGETLVARAREQARQVLEAAQGNREQVLSDMNVRRRAMFLQLEQLRAARDEIANVVGSVGESVGRLVEGIMSSDEAARLAAQEVVRRQPTPPEFEDAASSAPAAEGAHDAEPVPDRGLAVVAEAGEQEADEAALPDAGALEELFAKIRESARDTGLVPVVTPEGPAAALSDADAEAVRSRDELIEGPSQTLSRKIKRILQDEQNRILDGIRDGSIGTEFGDAGAVATAIAGATVDPLLDAARAGREYAQRHGGGNGAGLSDEDVVSIAEGLAASMLRTMEPRITEALGASDPAAQVSSAFREWRGPRIDRLVTDAALRAFSASLLRVTSGGKIRWIVASTDQPCADCSDNALEGAVASGSQFPTGQQHPPVHAGCRCVIVPALS